jgi:hypothetical protein
MTPVARFFKPSSPTTWGVTIQPSVKLGFVGMRRLQGFHPCTPPKNFLKKVLWNLKNFQKL